MYNISAEMHSKNEIKEKLRNSAFVYLKNIQTKHYTIRDIHYPKLETQQYMTSYMFNNEEVNLLHALRARYINVKANCSSRYHIVHTVQNGQTNPTYYNVQYSKENLKSPSLQIFQIDQKIYLHVYNSLSSLS